MIIQLRSMISLTGTQQHEVVVSTNAPKSQMSRFYEIDHKHLPPYFPTELRFMRIVLAMVTTKEYVRIRYPSRGSLANYLDPFGHFGPFGHSGHFGHTGHFGHSGYIQQYPIFSEYYDIDNELVSKVLIRNLTVQEFEQNKRTKSFWLLPNPYRPHPQDNRWKLTSPFRKIKKDNGSSGSIDHHEIQPASMIYHGLKRSSNKSKTPGASHSAQRSRGKVTPKETRPKVKGISQACEDLKDKNKPVLISLSDSEDDDDVVVVSDKQRPQAAAQTPSNKRKKLSPRNDSFHGNKKSETLQQTIDTRLDGNTSDCLSDEKMQEIINELLNAGISESDVGKAAEFCYRDPAKAKVLFAMPTHLRRSYVLGFLYPSN